MPELPHESLQRIRSLCHELAAKHGLDEQTRDELCGHLEDKLLGYLGGEVPITEEDALLLVRSHFGDAEQVARRLGRWSRLEAWGGMLARLRVTVAVSAGLLTLVAAGLRTLLSSGPYWIKGGLPLFIATAIVALVMVELPLYLAMRAGAMRLQDRLVAAWLLLAAVVLQAVYLIPTTGAISGAPVSIHTNAMLTVVIGAAAAVSLLCQVLLVLLLLNPLGSSVPRSGAPRTA